MKIRTTIYTKREHAKATIGRNSNRKSYLSPKKIAFAPFNMVPPNI